MSDTTKHPNVPDNDCAQCGYYTTPAAHFVCTECKANYCTVCEPNVTCDLASGCWNCRAPS
mgnify:CR=1 FL=1